MDYRHYLGELKVLPSVFNNFVQSDGKGVSYQHISYGLHEQQYMLFCESKEQQFDRKEFIYFIHGGGWRFGKPLRYLPLAKIFCALGYHVVLATHRRIPRYTFPDLYKDTFAAFQRALDIPQLGGKQSLMIGISAGGNLGGLLVYDRKGQASIGVNQNIFSGFVSVAGALDLSSLPDTPPLRSYAGKRDSQQFQLANPINYLQADEQTPVLCVHGTQDAIVPYESSVSFIQKLHQGQKPLADLHAVPKGTHFKTTTDWWLTANAETEVIVKWVQERSGNKQQ